VQDLFNQSGEGTAMLEIVHDMAPGAELLFATAGESMAQFAENIEALANAGGLACHHFFFFQTNLLSPPSTFCFILSH